MLRVLGRYSNLYYPTRWVPLRRRGLGWPRCNKLYEEHSCLASCGLIDSQLEIVLDLHGCNLNCKYCWCWKMRNSPPIVKDAESVARDILCRVNELLKDPIVAKSRYRLGVVRLTGNEPTLQWDHVRELIGILDNFDSLLDICKRNNFAIEAAELVFRAKIIIETNGVAVGLGKVDLELSVDNHVVDIDVSFKGVNPKQFSWLSSMPERLFDAQIAGFTKLFDAEIDNVSVNPCLGINHAPNYCVWRKGRKYVMDVEIIDATGCKMNFEEFSKEFEEEVLSRKSLRWDEAPFREYFGINRETTRKVVAVVYGGRRYLHVLPSEIPEIVKN